MVVEMEKKTIFKEDTDDLKISIAIMSTTVILTIQYFVLITFDLIDTTNGSIIQLLSKILVGGVFLYTFPSILKKNTLKVFLVYYIAIFIFLLHFTIFPENREYMKELIFPLFFMSLPVFIYSICLHDWTIFKGVMKKASVIIVLFGVVLGIQIFLGTATVGVYSMALSYYMLLPSILFLDDLLDRFSFKALIFTLMSLFIILAIGSRGALLCVCVFILLKLIRPNKTFIFSKFGFWLYLVFLGTLTILIMNLKNILLFLYDFLLKFGINSRNIILFLTDEVDLSGRDHIYEKITSEIVNHSIIGIGIAGDRRILDGVYAHNLFLEVLVNFGVLIGSMLIILFMLMMIYLLFHKSIEVYNMMIIWISIGLIGLLVSSSYLTKIEFWVLLGLMIGRIQKIRKSEILSREVSKDPSQ